MTAIQIEVNNATKFAHKNLYQAVEYLTVCHDHTFLDVIGVISEMMSEIAPIKESSHIIRTKARPADTTQKD